MKDQLYRDYLFPEFTLCKGKGYSMMLSPYSGSDISFSLKKNAKWEQNGFTVFSHYQFLLVNEYFGGDISYRKLFLLILKLSEENNSDFDFLMISLILSNYYISDRKVSDFISKRILLYIIGVDYNDKDVSEFSFDKNTKIGFTDYFNYKELKVSIENRTGIKLPEIKE